MESSPSPENKPLSQLDKVALITRLDQLWEQYGIVDKPLVMQTDTSKGTINNVHAEFYILGHYIEIARNSETYSEIGADEEAFDELTTVQVATPFIDEGRTYWNVDRYRVDDARRSSTVYSEEVNADGKWRRFSESVRVGAFTPKELTRLIGLFEQVTPESQLSGAPDIFKREFWTEQA